MRARTVFGVVYGVVLGGMLLVGGSALAQHGAGKNVRGAGSSAIEPDAANAPLGMLASGTAQMGGSGASDAEHTSLAKLAGEYDRVIKFVGQTGAMAAPSSGTSKFSVVLGGRFILEESHDTVFGRPVDGLRIYGYNDATKQYEMARMYTMSNAITIMEGTSSDSGKTIEFNGEAGARGGNRMSLRASFRQSDEDHFSVTMSSVGADGKDAPFQETDYARKK